MNESLINMACGPELVFNLFSLHAVQAKETIIPDSTDVHVLGGPLFFRMLAVALSRRRNRT